MLPTASWTSALLILLCHAPCPAHFHMLLPQTTSTARDKPVAFVIQWGHPFEHQLFDAPKPQSVTVLAPDGKKTDLTGKVEKVALPEGKDRKVTAYRLPFTPEARGDYIILLRTPPIWMGEDGEFLRDTVKVVLHVQAQALVEGKPRAGVMAEVERYNPTPPKALPPD